VGSLHHHELPDLRLLRTRRKGSVVTRGTARESSSQTWTPSPAGRELFYTHGTKTERNHRATAVSPWTGRWADIISESPFVGKMVGRETFARAGPCCMGHLRPRLCGTVGHGTEVIIEKPTPAHSHRAELFRDSRLVSGSTSRALWCSTTTLALVRQTDRFSCIRPAMPWCSRHLFHSTLRAWTHTEGWG
jgi:hypothetical protein